MSYIVACIILYPFKDTFYTKDYDYILKYFLQNVLVLFIYICCFDTHKVDSSKLILYK